MTNSKLLTVCATSISCICAAHDIAYGDGVPYHLEAVLPATSCQAVDLSPDGSKLYADAVFGKWDEGYVVFDTQTLQQIGECHLPSGAQWKFQVSPDGNSVWYTEYYGGYVREVDADTCKFIQEFPVGSWTVDLLFDDHRRFLYATENHPGFPVQGSIQVIDTWTDQVVASILLNGQLGLMGRAAGDRYLYVVTSNAGTETLYKIDTLDWTEAGTLPLFDLVGGDVGISVHPDFSTVYVPSLSMNMILVIDAASLTQIDSFPIGAPRGFFVAPSGDHALVIHDALPYISVVDLGSQSIIQSIDVGDSSSEWKRRPIWNKGGTKAYVPVGGRTGGVAVLTTVCSGDLDGDGVVGVKDLLELLGNWGACP